MRTLGNKIAALTFGCAALVASGLAARADVVCNGDGDCWHTREAYTYPPAAGIVVHPNAWTWSGDTYRWREHEGRGYWHGHDWVGF